jgi:hypothetical protein
MEVRMKVNESVLVEVRTEWLRMSVEARRDWWNREREWLIGMGIAESDIEDR